LDNITIKFGKARMCIQTSNKKKKVTKKKDISVTNDEIPHDPVVNKTSPKKTRKQFIWHAKNKVCEKITNKFLKDIKKVYCLFAKNHLAS